MRFNEIKKNKDPRVVKPRDPNFKVMQDIKKSGAAGSHGDKTKVIPRKEKYKDIKNEKVGDTWSVGDKFLINPDDAPSKKLTVDKIKGNIY